MSVGKSSGLCCTGFETSTNCRKYSTYVLLGTNGTLMFFSVAFLGIAIYRVALCSLFNPLADECGMSSTFDGESFRYFSNLGTISISIAGAVLMLVSSIGFISVWCNSKPLLAVYIVIVFVLIGALGSTAVLLLAYGGVIPNDAISNVITDLQASIYEECCFEAGFVDEGTPLCEDVQNVTDLCLDQEIEIDDSICDFLETVEVTDVDGFSVPLVGNTTLGGCGGDDGFPGFVDLFLSMTITDALIGFAAAEIVCVAIFLCTIIASFVLLCSNPEPDPTAMVSRVEEQNAMYSGKPVWQNTQMTPHVNSGPNVPIQKLL